MWKTFIFPQTALKKIPLIQIETFLFGATEVRLNYTDLVSESGWAFWTGSSPSFTECWKIKGCSQHHSTSHVLSGACTGPKHKGLKDVPGLIQPVSRRISGNRWIEGVEWWNSFHFRALAREDSLQKPLVTGRISLHGVFTISRG